MAVWAHPTLSWPWIIVCLDIERSLTKHVNAGHGVIISLSLLAVLSWLLPNIIVITKRAITVIPDKHFSSCNSWNNYFLSPPFTSKLIRALCSLSAICTQPQAGPCNHSPCPQTFPRSSSQLPTLTTSMNLCDFFFIFHSERVEDWTAHRK